ncbi:MAG TPA: helix-turn-helix domain-containing protein [Naasia sp.]|jgi:hypothetical protein
MNAVLTAPEAAAESRRHPVTVRKALEASELHGTQRMKGGRWSIRRECLNAWIDGQKCAHLAPSNVTPMRRPA